MAAHAPSVLWACAVCPKREWRMPSQAKTKCCYGCRGAYVRRFGSLSHAKAMENRQRRVMLAKGYTQEKAAIWLDGFRHGRKAEKMARLRGIVAGSVEWERSA